MERKLNIAKRAFCSTLFGSTVRDRQWQRQLTHGVAGVIAAFVLWVSGFASAAQQPQKVSTSFRAPRSDLANAEAMANHKQEATVNLAHYAAKASKQALQVEDPLSHARQVRDVAAVYRTIYPPEDGGELIEGAILIGAGVVKDNPVEIQERVIDVRENVSDQGPESH